MEKASFPNHLFRAFTSRGLIITNAFEHRRPAQLAGSSAIFLLIQTGKMTFAASDGSERAYDLGHRFFPYDTDRPE